MPEGLEAGVWGMAAVALFGGLTSLLLFREVGDRHYASYAWVCLCVLVYDLLSVLGYQVDPWGETLLMVKARVVLMPVIGFYLILFLEQYLGLSPRGWLFGLLGYAVVFGLLAIANPAGILFTPGVEASLAPTVFFLVNLALRNLVFFGLSIRIFRTLSRTAPERLSMYGLGAAALLGGMVWDDGVQLAAWNGPRLSEFGFPIMLGAMAVALARRQASRRREAEANDRRLKSILDALPDRAAIFDSQATRLEPLHFPGTPQPVPAGAACPLEAAFPASAIPGVRATVLRTALTGRGQSLEYAVEEEGQTRWYEARTAAIPGGLDGSRNDGVVWVSRDITRNKLLEIEIEAGVEKYGRLFHAFPDALLIAGLEGGLLRLNERAEALFGFSRESMLRPWSVRDLYAPDSRGEFEADMEQLRKKGQIQVEQGFQKIGGQPFKGELQAASIPFRDRLLALLAVRDIGESRGEDDRLERRLRLEGMMRFAGAVAPDFAARLTGIADGVARLAEDYPRGSKEGECLAVMRKAAERGLEMTRNLLSFAQRGVRSATVLDIGATVSALQEELSRALPPEVRFSLELPDRPIWISGDPDEIRRMLVHLTENARDAMPVGGPLRIVVERVDISPEWAATEPECPGAGRYAAVRVIDAGAGLTEEARQCLFTPFFTTQRQMTTAGLGLPMVYGAIKAHGGFVEVSGKSGTGTSFSLYFHEAVGVAPPPTNPA